VFQPEVAADAVWKAATAAPRELWLGWRNSLTMLGSMVAAPVLDALLGASGFESQQRGDGADPQPYGRHNLFEPVDDEQDVGMHGAFDDEARERSLQLDVRSLVPRVPTAVAHGVGRALARVLG
jgi:hypothetical protein